MKVRAKMSNGVQSGEALSSYDPTSRKGVIQEFLDDVCLRKRSLHVRIPVTVRIEVPEKNLKHIRSENSGP
ncbi:hypothetical protein NPIL_314621 [Nephila pilipes]|uniref:Uncharacterized protein n=1 Tax=Nephila pilipes TaxID=299642 RepID=A0A8X6PII7_NEPPI|nr:hypothetical protein NPIL_314621 [Nephila pilipes]